MPPIDSRTFSCITCESNYHILTIIAPPPYDENAPTPPVASGGNPNNTNETKNPPLAREQVATFKIMTVVFMVGFSPVSTNRASPTTFALTKSGIRYFICGTAGHCAQGMKVEIPTIEPFPFPPPGSALPPETNDGPRSGSDPDDYDDAPVPPGAKQSPKPGSAATVEIMSVASMLGFGLLLMI
nr:uclacyanin 1-like [Tanacetum cinerariifolium]